MAGQNNGTAKRQRRSYSLGSGQRFEDFSTWPEGFSVENFQDVSEQFYQLGRESVSEQCSATTGWTIQGGEIRYQPTACVSKLRITLHLVQTGYIEFYYKMPKNSRGLTSNVDVRNEQCQSYGSQLAALLHPDDMQSNGDWKIKRLELRRGQNLVTWTVSNNRELTTLADIIYIAKIDVVGLPYTSSCSKCPPGTFSNEIGQQVCKACSQNHYSRSGATVCSECAENQYSDSKSSACFLKPPCQEYDFYPLYGRCQDNKQTIDYTPGPVFAFHTPRNANQFPFKKPSTKHDEKCRRCSPGQERTPDGVCAYCPLGSHSNGTQCQACPVKTRPNYGYFFNNWERFPVEVDTSCEYATFEENKECNIRPSWIPLGDRIESSPTRDKGIAMELNINVPSGFYNPIADSKPTADDPVSTFSIDIETRCADESCTLYMVQEIQSNQRNFRFLSVTNGSQPRQVLQFPIYHNGKSKFIIAFMRSGAATGNDIITDKTVVYSVNLTNVGDAGRREPKGGADSCLPCPAHDAAGRCQGCPPGHYVDAVLSQCVHCPPGTMLNKTSSRIGKDSCIKCGNNMESDDGIACTFSGRYTLNETDAKPLKFDLSPLKQKTLVAEGIRVFAREGSSYFHVFNVSLFGEGVDCKESIMAQASLMHEALNSDTSTETSTLFCRSTAIPLQSDKNDSSVSPKTGYLSPFAIGHKLGSVTRERVFEGFNLTDKDLEYDGMTKESRPIDVHFFFAPLRTRVRSCANGSIGVVTARCEPTATGAPQVRLPRSCPDGTCNGCLFHVIIETSAACPLCDNTDFEQIRGECVDGKQQVHWIPSKHCVLSGAQAKEKTEACTSFGGLKFLLILAAVLIGFLVLIIFVIYQRNKSLEYRYMRIVEGREPETLESCGLESDDDDLDEEDTNATRVYFGRKKNELVAGVTKANITSASAKKFSNKPKTPEETTLFSDISDD
uniref:UPF0577 protein n=1 Tax=Panagrellus redivivus TaxID=6233 RepID=A0A7E4VPQ6_PANRE